MFPWRNKKKYQQLFLVKKSDLSGAMHNTVNIGPHYLNRDITLHAGLQFQQTTYRIRPNYRTVGLGFSKALGKLVVKYSPNKSTL